MSALGLSLMGEAIRRFTAARPGVIISLDVRNSLGVLELTAANQIDVGFVHSVGTEYPGVDVFSLPSVPAVCVLPRGHALARKKSVQISDLEGESLISLSQNNPLRLRLDMALDSARVKCRRPVETSLAYSACSMVAGGLGIAVVDPFTAAHVRGPAVACRPLAPTVPFEFCMAVPTHQPRSKAVNDFIHVMKELIESGGTFA
jgi:DNA-binding transcriptional LysR family regulator